MLNVANTNARASALAPEPVPHTRVADIMRVVSLACSNTEIVHALGCAAMLVGVDDHSDWPEEVVAPMPRLGPDLDIDVDAVKALRPDLVLATLTVPGHENVVARLESAGIPFVAPEPVSLDDVYGDILDIGALLGVPERAASVVAGMRAELDAPKPPADAPRVLVQWWPKPVITPGRLSWATDVLHAAGARSVLDHEAVKSRPMSDEEVAQRQPDAVVLSWCGVHPSKYRPDVVLGNPAWENLTFVRERRVYCVGEPFLGRPGPRLVEGVRAIRAVMAGFS